MRSLPLSSLVLAALAPAPFALPAAASPLARSAAVRPAALDEADEQYQLIANLAERGLHEVAVKEALAFLERFADHPKAPLARYRLATSLFELDRIEEAREEFARLAGLGGFQFQPEVLFRLGQCELYLGRPAEAAAPLERVLALGRDYLVEPATFFLGEARFRTGAFETAEESYLAVLEGGSAEYERDASYGLAWCAFRLGRYEDAIRRIEGFLAAHGDDSSANELRFLLGESQLAAGRPEAALAAYRSVGPEGRGARGAHEEPSLRGAAFALAELGRNEEAARVFEALLERFPEGEHALEAQLHRGIQWLRAGSAERALAALRSSALDADPSALYWRAQAELAGGEAEAALATLEAALALEGLDAELRERLSVSRGDALYDLGRGGEAVGAYSASSSEYALYAAAVAAMNEGRLGEAVELARRVLEERPETTYRAELLLVLGEGALAEGRYQRAETAFTTALEAPGAEALAPRALSRAGWCRYLAGDPSGSCELFARVAREHAMAPEAEEALFMLGQARQEAGDAAGAAEAWRQYVDAYPAGPRRGEALFGLAEVDPEGAPRWLEATLAEGGDEARSAFALFELAEQDAAGGACGSAIDRYRALIERFPSDPNVAQARYGLAFCLYQEGRHADAATALEPFASDSSASSGGASRELALSALELAVWARAGTGDGGATAEAFGRFQQACEDDQRLWNAARTTVATLQAAGDAGGAQAVLDGLLSELSDPALTQAVLVEGAWLGLERGLVDDAEAAVRAALELAERRGLEAGELGDAAFFVAEARYEAGQYPRAAELYAAAAARSEGDLAARSNYKLGFARLAVEDWAGAAQAFGALVEGHPGHELHGEGQYLLGESLFRGERFAEAVAPLTALADARPDHASVPKALFRLGLAHGRLEQWPACEEALARLAARAPEFELMAEAELWRGHALAAQGDRRAARAAYDRVVARDKTVLAARARIGIGKLALEAGEAEDALSEFLKVALLFADPEEVGQALYLAGNALEAMGDVDRARAQYGELIEAHGETRAAVLAKKRLRELGDRAFGKADPKD